MMVNYVNFSSKEYHFETAERLVCPIDTQSTVLEQRVLLVRSLQLLVLLLYYVNLSYDISRCIRKHRILKL
jgi:hypothetical protein